MADAADVKLNVSTPELDKQHACNEPRAPFDVLSDFYDWLESEGFVLARYGRHKERSATCPTCRGRRFSTEGLTGRQRQLLAAGALSDHEREPCEKCEGTGTVWMSYVDEDSLQPVTLTPEALFARFWGLDLEKIRNEREEILSALRENAPQRCKICQEPTEADFGVCDKDECHAEWHQRREDHA